jgi:hypothetical protein
MTQDVDITDDWVVNKESFAKNETHWQLFVMRENELCFSFPQLPRTYE